MASQMFLDHFFSATLAGTSNQSTCVPAAPMTCVAFYRVRACHERRFSLLFSNIIDSTFADGDDSRAGDVCRDLTVSDISLSVTVGVGNDARVLSTVPVTMSGATSVTLSEAGFTATDPACLSVGEGQYLSVRLTVSGEKIPTHPENTIPTFRVENGVLVPSKDVYLPSSVASDEPSDLRVGFIGDSITQGIGCAEDSYAHYTAVCADLLSERSTKKLSFWNLGIGFGRASDFAVGGSWLQKAVNCDIVTLCFGVNDIFHDVGGAPSICENIAKCVRLLKSRGCYVVLQTVPPFDLDKTHEAIRRRINDFILRDLVSEADFVFDETALLSDPSDASKVLYGTHPNEKGCAVWGRELADALLPLIERL